MQLLAHGSYNSTVALLYSWYCHMCQSERVHQVPHTKYHSYWHQWHGTKYHSYWSRWHQGIDRIIFVCEGWTFKNLSGLSVCTKYHTPSTLVADISDIAPSTIVTNMTPRYKPNRFCLWRLDFLKFKGLRRERFPEISNSFKLLVRFRVNRVLGPKTCHRNIKDPFLNQSWCTLSGRVAWRINTEDARSDLGVKSGTFRWKWCVHSPVCGEYHAFLTQTALDLFFL